LKLWVPLNRTAPQSHDISCPRLHTNQVLITLIVPEPGEVGVNITIKPKIVARLEGQSIILWTPCK
jgi:hypothetical protein